MSLSVFSGNYQLLLVEKEPYLPLRIFIGRRRVHNILAGRSAVKMPDRARRGFLRIRGADHLAQLLRSFRMLQAAYHDRSGRNEIAQPVVEILVFVDLVEPAALFPGKLDQLHAHDLESGVDYMFQDRADKVSFNGVGFDYQ